MQSANPRDYFASSNTPYAMTQTQQTICLQTNQEWCDPSKAYATSIRMNQYTLNGDSVKEITYGGNTMYELQYGQWVRGSRFYGKGSVALNNILGALFIEDNMKIPLGYIGALNIRPGLRIDSDSYMGKVTFAPRFSLNYQTPWNEGNIGQHFATQITAGANRYYGRNIFAYAISGQLESLRRDVSRSEISKSFEEILAEGRVCANRNDDNCISTIGVNTTKFSQLKVPYADELMIGISQRIYDMNLGIKYIYRAGRDEIRRSSRSVSNLPTDSNYSSNYYIYTNEGISTTNVITLTLENTHPLKILGVKNHIFFAFDWTNVNRNYTDYSDTLTNQELANQWISWNGQIIRYADKPAENFNRPYTLRLNTTHTFNVGKTKWLLNNFFRYRSSYKAMASTLATSTVATRPPDKIDLDGDGIPETPVDTFRPLDIKGAFTWDMRLGFEVDMHKGNTMYMNVDIYNVLDAKNLAIASAAYSTTAGTTATPVYEVGRQFWLQLGYRY
ncbi:hypothetical protein V3I05_01340 [Helicobacter mastomyrinus]|uniref:TonB-dependent receptor n=2 Tax=Helicobacter TaxID=209 RepID=A0ABZ3F819_9HELI